MCICVRVHVCHYVHHLSGACQLSDSSLCTSLSGECNLLSVFLCAYVLCVWCLHPSVFVCYTFTLTITCSAAIAVVTDPPPGPILAEEFSNVTVLCDIQHENINQTHWVVQVWE